MDFIICEKMETCEKKVDVLLTDRISALPDSLIDCILDFLSLPDAVRTCVLSKRWKLCWTRVRRIVFDSDVLKRYIIPKRLEVESVVDSVLSRHEGPVHEFNLSGSLDWNHIFDVKIDGMEEKNRVVRRWIQMLSDNGLRKFTFFLLDVSHFCLPLSLLNCSTLTHLELELCQLVPSHDFRGISNLVNLHLDHVSISASLLETVISSSAQLKVLRLCYPSVHFDGEDGKVIVINAPSLETLFIQHDDEPFYLKEAPYLTQAHVEFKVEVPTEGYNRSTKLDDFFRVMPIVETLRMNKRALTSLAVGQIPPKLPRTLQSLKELVLDGLDIVSLSQMACVFCLIRSSPTLESLIIYLGHNLSTYEDNLAAVRFYEAQEKDGILSCLSKIEFVGLMGYDYEVMFLDTFLNCCPKVKTVSISSYNPGFEELAKRVLPKSATLKFQLF